MDSTKNQKAYFHLPGLFEFYTFYENFLPIFQEHREYFYDWCEIGSIYGAPTDCIWGGGRVELSEEDPEDIIRLLNRYQISPRLTFSNSLLREEHLSDSKCNAICKTFAKNALAPVGMIVASDLLLDYASKQYPSFHFISSTTKVITSFDGFEKELNNPIYAYVVPDFRLNPRIERWGKLSTQQKRKVEFLCNECCDFVCRDRKICYETVSRKNLGEVCPEHRCKAPGAAQGYLFSKAMENPGFLSTNQIKTQYLPMGFTNYKIEGRGLGSAFLLEFILYYMTKPEYHIHVREHLYLDSMLDLF